MSKLEKMNSPYVDDSGRQWRTYQEYCDSDAPDFDCICVMLETGRREPQNDWEREYVKECERYKKLGIATELPFN